jgi:hypothetical protein
MYLFLKIGWRNITLYDYVIGNSTIRNNLSKESLYFYRLIQGFQEKKFADLLTIQNFEANQICQIIFLILFTEICPLLLNNSNYLFKLLGRICYPIFERQNFQVCYFLFPFPIYFFDFFCVDFRFIL